MNLSCKSCIHLQLFGLLEAQPTERIQPDYLHIALLAWLQLEDITAAHAAMQRHRALTNAWTAQQQRFTFESALHTAGKLACSDAALHLAQQIWMIAVSNNLPDKELQLQSLVSVLLSKSQLPEAHRVSNRFGFGKLVVVDDD